MLMAKSIGARTFKNKNELEEYLFCLWDNLKTDVITKFIDKLKEKMAWIEENGGDIFNA